MDLYIEYEFPEPEELDPTLKKFIETWLVFCTVCNIEMPPHKAPFHLKPKVCKACKAAAKEAESAPKRLARQAEKQSRLIQKRAARDESRSAIAAKHGVWASYSEKCLRRRLVAQRKGLLRVLRTRMYALRLMGSKRKLATADRTERKARLEAYLTSTPLRKCKKCEQEKPLLAGFPKSKLTGRPAGYVCKTCINRAKRLAQKTREKAHRLANPLSPKLSPEERLRRTKESKRRSKQKARQDVMHRINRNFSEKIRQQFRNMNAGKTCGGWKQHVGYTLLDLKRHLEAQFTEGMTWENYGEWHIDHKRPKASFVFTSPDDSQFLGCWSLENLQPLWGAENSKKGAKIL